jgi:hypothetical protein
MPALHRWKPARRLLLRPLALALLLLALALPGFAAAAGRVHAAQGNLLASVPSTVRIDPAVDAAAPGPVVRVGLHVRNIYDLSLVNQSFLAEGWYWFEWGPDVQAILEARAIDPDDLIELANEIELGQYESRKTAAYPSELVTPGQDARIVRFSGKFYLEDVPQRFAPFDPQRVTISLEVKPEILALGSQPVRLEPLNKASSIVGESVDISGFDLDSVAWQRSLVSYPDEFLPRMRFSRITAVFLYGKNEWAAFLKWIFPVLIVMAIVIVSPSIEGVLGDIRLAIPPSALLALVVMQDTYKNSFPPAPYLTYLDEIYVYSYIVCLAIFLLFMVGTNIIARAPESERERFGLRVNRIDTVVQVSLVVGFALVGIVGWFT